MGTHRMNARTATTPNASASPSKPNRPTTRGAKTNTAAHSTHDSASPMRMPVRSVPFSAARSSSPKKMPHKSVAVWPTPMVTDEANEFTDDSMDSAATAADEATTSSSQLNTNVRSMTVARVSESGRPVFSTPPS